MTSDTSQRILTYSVALAKASPYEPRISNTVEKRLPPFNGLRRGRAGIINGIPCIRCVIWNNSKSECRFDRYRIGIISSKNESRVRRFIKVRELFAKCVREHRSRTTDSNIFCKPCFFFHDLFAIVREQFAIST